MENDGAQIKHFFVDLKMVIDNAVSATGKGMSYGSKPLLTSTELADIYQSVSSSVILAVDPDQDGKEAKHKKPPRTAAEDGSLEPPHEEESGKAAGLRKLRAAPKTSQHLGLRLPEFVDLLQVRHAHVNV